MDFDIRTFDTAYYSLLDLLQMTGQEFVEEYAHIKNNAKVHV